jgi:hypothetical protein
MGRAYGISKYPVGSPSMFNQAIFCPVTAPFFDLTVTGLF